MSPHLANFFASTDDCGNNQVRVKDPARVSKIVEGLTKAGPDGILDGNMCQSCHGALRCSPMMPAEFHRKANAIWAKYYPIEIDGRLTTEQKIPFIEKWYGESHKNLLSQSLHEEDLKRIVLNSQIKLRDSAEDMLACLSKWQIPVLVFSGGIGNVLEYVLENSNCRYPNMTVVSNFLDFNSQGLVTGFKGPLIHVFNKTSKTLRQCRPEYLEKLRDRKHVILMGDSLGDIAMADGIEDLQSVLKIGFLNTNVDERLESFIESFDIVLIDDQSMNVPNSILQLILG